MKIVVDDEVERLIRSLQKPTTAKLLRSLDLLEKYGRDLGMPHVKLLTGGLCELRVRGQQEVRLLFVFRSNQIVLLHGFVKKSQKTPRSELETAIKRARRLTDI